MQQQRPPARLMLTVPQSVCVRRDRSQSPAPSYILNRTFSSATCSATCSHRPLTLAAIYMYSTGLQPLLRLTTLLLRAGCVHPLCL